VRRCIEVTKLLNNTDKLNIVAIVVTFNRKHCLKECILALLNQTLLCDVLIIDNASTDGTKTYLDEQGFIANPRVNYINMPVNLGGSGGFYEGLQIALEGQWQWFWLMDDDALPDPQALKNLENRISDNKDIYGSVAIGKDNINGRLCFPLKTTSKKDNKFIEYHDDMHEIEKLCWIPFLGFLIHRNTVKKIGLPDKDFFILNDDVEYSERAKKFGSKIFSIKSSIIYHPIQDTFKYQFLNIIIYYRSMPPWKVYYDVRNKILTAKKHYPKSLWIKTLPGILMRAILSMYHEQQKIDYFSTYIKAIKDGLLGINGQKTLF
jgi:rhamnopyranosyl-N-acetylglucosaminyl-diphospho-decaprenol beta-1,3/1,4-galactofuranosyltransferase